MIELLITIFTGGGAVGLGSIFKMVAGFIDSKNQAREIREHQRILKASGEAKDALAFQKAVFGDTPGGLFARGTRRMLALIGVSTLAVCTLVCFNFPNEPFITLPSIAGGDAGQTAFQFFFITIPKSNQPLQLTLGHIGLMNCIAFQLTLGYYFTPGGRK